MVGIREGWQVSRGRGHRVGGVGSVELRLVRSVSDDGDGGAGAGAGGVGEEG